MCSFSLHFRKCVSNYNGSITILKFLIVETLQYDFRALEQSLAEDGTLAWKDPLNPHERKRNGSWPVGIKNVGNICWFSAVIQSLFHICVFRNLILNFHWPKEEEFCLDIDMQVRYNYIIFRVSKDVSEGWKCMCGL